MLAETHHMQAFAVLYIVLLPANQESVDTAD